MNHKHKSLNLKFGALKVNQYLLVFHNPVSLSFLNDNELVNDYYLLVIMFVIMLFIIIIIIDSCNFAYTMCSLL